MVMYEHFPSNLYGWSPSPSPHACVAQERWYTLGFRHGRDGASNAAGEVPAEFREFYGMGFRDGERSRPRDETPAQPGRVVSDRKL